MAAMVSDQFRPGRPNAETALLGPEAGAGLNAETARKDWPAVAVRLLTKRYGDKLAVNQVDLDVPRGCFYGIVGPNGAGKTTTIRMLTGLLRPDAGQAWVEGHDVWADPVSAKARIAELLDYCGLLRGLDPAVVADRAGELLDVLDLRGAADTLIVDYSTGMRKKAALAAALLHGPSVLFLDEPFEAIDPVSTRAIRSVLERFTDNGHTVLFSSHVMEVVERLCDRVAVVHQGRIIAEGATDDLRGGRRLEDVFVELVGAGETDTGALGWLGNGAAAAPGRPEPDPDPDPAHPGVPPSP
jgi:ABC-2 type transport system ATP-binding protein